MTITPLNLGAVANDGNGQDLRSGGVVINANFAELDARTAAAQSKADAAIPALQKGVASGVATLDADSKIPISQLPPLAINEVFTVATQAAMLALTAQRGDMAIRTDQAGQAYVLAADAPTVLANWIQIKQSLAVALVALGAVTPAVDTIAYFSGPATAATTAFPAKARALLARTDTAGMQAELGLGTAATANVTATQFGGTTGQLMKVGDFGLGSNANAYVSDVNALTTSRFFSYGTSVSANISPNMDYGEGVILFGANFNEASALFMNHDTDRTFGKRKRAGVWQAPYEFHTTANSQLDPALGTGGLMSSTVVSGWTIEKFANGTMIYSGLFTTNVLAASVVSFVYITIPSGFVNENYIDSHVACLARLDPNFYVPNCFASNGTTTIVVQLRNGPTAQIFDLRIKIIGRWK